MASNDTVQQFRLGREARNTVRSNTLGEMLLASHRLNAAALPRFELQSSDFRNNDLLPTRATIDGDGTPPPLSWGLLVPPPASLALICEDPDSAGATPFVHWVVYGISGNTQSLDANLRDFREGLNDQGTVGFAPAAPTWRDPPHRYVFQLFALDTDLSLPPGITCDELVSAMQGHVIVWGELIGLYERP
jgi:Raf kinase inhibitor-like YbhB/YbcL family protein